MRSNRQIFCYNNGTPAISVILVILVCITSLCLSPALTTTKKYEEEEEESCCAYSMNIESARARERGETKINIVLQHLAYPNNRVSNWYDNKIMVTCYYIWNFGKINTISHGSFLLYVALLLDKGFHYHDTRNAKHVCTYRLFPWYIYISIFIIYSGEIVIYHYNFSDLWYQYLTLRH